MVFFEAPHSFFLTLQDMLVILGDRSAAVCRELTKLHEEVHRARLSELVTCFQEKSPRGEMVLVIEGYLPPPPAEITVEMAAQEVVKMIEQVGANKKEALKIKASQYGLKKSDLYKAVEQILDEN